MIYICVSALIVIIFAFCISGHLIPPPQKGDIVALSIDFLIISLILFYKVVKLKRGDYRKMNELREASEKIALLERILAAKDAEKTCDSEPCKSDESESSDSDDMHEYTEKELRERLMRKLSALADKEEGKCVADELILSPAYAAVQAKISAGDEIAEEDTLWDELESTVRSVSPDFKTNLTLLAGGRLSSYDLRTAMLIKCGVSPSHMAVLFNRSRGAIGSRRESLGKRLFGLEKNTKMMDRLIRQL